MLVTRVTEMMVLMMNDDNLKTFARQKNTNIAVAHKYVCLKTCLRKTNFCTNAFAHRNLYMQMLSPTEKNPETSQFWRTHTHTNRCRFYIQALLHNDANKHRHCRRKLLHTEYVYAHVYDFYTHAFLHIKKVTRKTRNIFLTRKTITHKTCDAQNLLHTELRHTSTFTFDTQVPLTTGTFTQKYLHTDALYTQLFHTQRLLRTETYEANSANKKSQICRTCWWSTHGSCRTGAFRKHRSAAPHRRIE